MYALLCVYPFFNGDTDEEISNAIQKRKFTFPKEQWEGISSLAKD